MRSSLPRLLLHPLLGPWPVLSWLALLAVLLASAACGDDLTYVNEPPTGGYGPVGGGGPGGYGASGASTASGGQGGDPGPPPCDVELRRCPHLFTLSFGGESSVEVRGNYAPDGWTVGTPMTIVGDQWEASIEVPWDAPVQYKFVIDGVTWITDPANPDLVDDGFGNFNSLIDGITCEEWSCAPPLLGDFDWRDAVLYFVFVDRFVDGDPSNNGAPIGGVQAPAAYQGGDWAGVLSKIDEGYFDDLGVNVLWLSVPMNNTDDAGAGDDGHQYSAYHGYWPTDLDQTEARFGSLDELVAVVDAAHARDIKVIVDYAMNHVHISSPIYQSHADWFWPLDNGGQYCVCGADCSWDGDEGKRCWFRDYLPDFDFTNSEARDFSVSNAIQWIVDTGIDGFRLDAVKHIEDSWILDLRARVKSEIEPLSGQHFYMVGETFTGDKGTIAYYVDPTTMLDGQFDFPLRNALINALLIRSGSMFDLDGFLAGNDGYYGAGIMSTFIGNHDVPRSIHFAQDTPLWNDAWADGKGQAWNNTPSLPGGLNAFERMANAFAILYTLPGVPLIYYGDEIGMAGAGDPDNRRFMQWSGLTAGQTFLHQRLGKLAEIRAAHPALRRGVRTTLNVTGDTITYRMTTAGDEVFVAINRGDVSANVDGLPASALSDEIDGSSHSGPSVPVPARSARILVQP